MVEMWKRYETFVDHVNIVTKLLIGIILFFFIIFVHNFDVMLYLALVMFIYLMIFNGSKLKVVLLVTSIGVIFSLISSLFMIFYGKGSHTLFKFGIIHITTESLFRGLHLSLRTMTMTFYGVVIAFTSQIVMVFYSLMQNLKLKPKFAYAFMAAIRMVPLMIESLGQLRNALKMRYQIISRSNYKGLNYLKHLVIPLLSQNIRKAHRLSVAMEKKGFKDGPRTYYYHAPLSYRDVLFVIMLILIVSLAFVLAHMFPITGIMDVR
ncbi:energy-coupling factor transporter transmembrane protein EcfT [Staphylococcus massiliensis]|uniref:energy-coupling factor transporter transmembrane component T family protein n=1 Tax=Staphylococcus massiliensis TaxID=555791 RepID=UPI001EDF8FD3|nr:energy-coupling factor transporter transmembrane component T [Staphylococcus massiliensis]MCG3401514.1 energy-coupling factor transporter transmembrane protein EcfT [Staphylococcus massiliensis]